MTRSIYRKLQAFFYSLSKENAEIILLKKHVKAKKNEEAYSLSKKILKQNPKLEYALFIKGWSCFKLELYQEAIDTLTFLIKDKQDNTRYYSIRGNSLLKLNQNKEALNDFNNIIRLNNDDNNAQTRILQIKSKLGIDTFGYSNQVEIQHNLAQTFKKRDWEKFAFLLDKMKEFDEITFKFWELKRSLFFVEINNPSQSWEALSNECTKIQHPLSVTVYKNYVISLIETEDLDKIISSIHQYKVISNTYFPIAYLSNLCALFLKKKEYKKGIAFINDLEMQVNKDEDLLRFKLKTTPYLIIFQEKIHDKTVPLDNIISDSLIKKMQLNFQKESASMQVLNSGLKCWSSIHKSTHELLLDIRYRPQQAQDLRAKILTAVKSKTPLLLLRIGDGECYGFSDIISNSNTLEISETLEEFWWGKKITPQLREKITQNFISTLKEADIIGMPYAIRLSQVLTGKKETALSYADNRLNIVFSGVAKLFDLPEALNVSCWTDEYCNYAFINDNFINSLIDNSTNIVIVTCFQIPKGNIFDHPKIEIVVVPPAVRVSTLEGTIKSDKVLPEILLELSELVCKNLREGSVALICAGFAGKFLLKNVKEKGAVAIDFGSSIDSLLNLSTRSSELNTLYN